MDWTPVLSFIVSFVWLTELLTSPNSVSPSVTFMNSPVPDVL